MTTLLRAIVCTVLYFSALVFLLSRPTDVWDWPVVLAFVVAVPACWIGMEAWYQLYRSYTRGGVVSTKERPRYEDRPSIWWAIACWADALLIVLVALPWYGLTHSGTMVDQLAVWGMVLVSMSVAIAGNLFLQRTIR